ncbi:MAG: phenylalanine--tRNA ligase subunit beta [Anaerolineae bacterium]
MRVPLSWLKEYVALALPIGELSERLTYGGLEVSGVEHVGDEWAKDAIFVGQVVSVRQHPNADRLVLVTVTYGQSEPVEVVTGAPNLHVGDSGQKVVFATIGARLIDPYADTLKYQTLKRSKIRGIDSVGMVCSEKELGISQEHGGIIILPEDAPVGTPFADYWGDTVLDIDLTPNLARCFSITGVAREAAALTGSPLRLPDPQVVAEGDPIAGRIDIVIQDPDLCPRYSAALIRNVRIGPSPWWMQRRLLMAGMRPINNIVDITNYVMLEWGQPLHAFDYRLLHAREADGPPTIIVRRAHPGERMATLDGVERTLRDDMLLITDGAGPVAVAGVMGSLESEIRDDTVDILLESANFNNISIRRTSAGLKLASEAAQRFGRGVDPELTLAALRRAAELMRQFARGTVASGFADNYPAPSAQRVIDLKISEVKRVLGIDLTPEEIADMLRALGFTCEPLAGDPPVVRTEVPSFRLDVALPADLLEEVARMYGYDRLPTRLHVGDLPNQRRNLSLEMEERVRDILVGCGLTEAITYSLTDLESVAALTPERAMPAAEDYMRIANPLSREQEFMRRSLLASALKTTSANLRFVDRVAIFEIANVYLPCEGQVLPQEPRRLSIALCGPREPRSWLAGDDAPMDFYDLKGIVETLLEHLGIAGTQYEPTRHPSFHPGRVAALRHGEDELGVLGEIHPAVRANLDLPEVTVCALELDLEKVLDLAVLDKRFTPISRMPVLREDLALVVEDSVPADAVEATIRETGGALLVDVVLFDVYRGQQLGAGNKSLAYRLTFQAPDKTLTSEQAAKQRDRIAAALERQHGARVRGA